MSILIKGMEMPMNCCRCPCADLEYYDCNLMPGTGISSDRKSGKRRDDCPLVPVPPHGRLIDGDVAEGIYFTEEDENGKDFCDGILYAADWISKQPTIIPPSGGKKDE